MEQLFVINRYEGADTSIDTKKQKNDTVHEEIVLNSEKNGKKRKRKLKNVIKDESNITEQVNGIGSQEGADTSIDTEKQKNETIGEENVLNSEQKGKKRKHKLKNVIKDESNIAEQVNGIGSEAGADTSIDTEKQKNETIGEENVLNSEQKGKKRKRKLKNVIEGETNIAEELNGIGSDAEVEDLENVEKGKQVTDSLGTGFTILGDNKFNKKYKVKRILPKWLLNPTKIATSLQDLQTKVSSIKDLDKDLRKKLKHNNVKYFFPVQASVIPWLLRSNKQSNMIIPSDICVSAPTGSGKTLAFVLPVVQALKSYRIKRIRALVILPTQDLATQVYRAFKTYVDNTHIDVGLITGNCAFQMEDGSNSGLCNDILVCTPGRLVDYLKETNMLDLQHLKFLVIDEADRIMDNMQNDWLYHLENHMQQNSNNLQSTKILNLFTMKHRPVQKLLFSATLSLDPEKLQQLSLFQPKLFTCVSDITSDAEVNDDTYIGKYALPSELTEKYIQCDKDLKPLILYKFIKDIQLNRIIIFTNSTDTSRRLSILLQALFKDKLKIQPIFSQLESNHRARLINDFVSGNVNIIVCTDSYARGIDLPNVQCVISYTVPKFLKTYIHRVGRTARAGESGLAVTLVSKGFANKLTTLFKEKKSLEEIIISEESLELLENKYSKALETLGNTMSKHKAEDFRKMMSAKKHKKRKMINNVIKK